MTRRTAAALAALLPLLILATLPAAAAAPAPDPYERFNRTVFGFNQWLYAELADAVTAPPVALPAGMRQDLGNVFRTLREPLSTAAGLAVGDFDTAWNAAARFAVNATAGAMGTRDVAAGLGLPPDQVNLGTELCRARLAVDPPYLVLPLIGPTNLGDIGGQLATNFALRLLLGSYYLPYYLPYYVLDRIDLYMERQPPAPLPAGAADPYAVQRAQYFARYRSRCALPPGATPGATPGAPPGAPPGGPPPVIPAAGP